MVSAENNRVPTFIPANGVSGSGHHRLLQRRQRAARRRDRGCRRRRHRGPCRRLQDRRRQLRTSRAASSATRPHESQGGAVGISAIGDRGFVGISFSHYDALYQIPGGEAGREPDPPRPAPGPGPGARRVPPARRPVRGDPVLGRRLGLPPRRDRHRRGRDRRHPGHLQEPRGRGAGRAPARAGLHRARHADRRARLPVRTARAQHAGRGGRPAAPTESRCERGLPLRAAGSAAAACASRRPGRIEGDPLRRAPRRSFPRDYLPVDGQDPPPLRAGRARSPRRAPASAPCRTCPTASWRASTAPMSSGRPRPTSCSRRGRTTRPRPSRSAIPNLKKERARTVEASIRRARGAAAPRRDRLLHALYRLHLQARHRPPLRRRLRLLRQRTTNFGRSSTRSRTPPSTAPRSAASSTCSRSATASPASRRSTTSSARSSTTAPTCRASRPTALGGGVFLRDRRLVRPGEPAPRLRPRGDRPVRDGHARLRRPARRGELHQGGRSGASTARARSPSGSRAATCSTTTSATRPRSRRTRSCCRAATSGCS